MVASRRRAAYRSELREEQAQQTRERILDALVAQLAEDGWPSFSIARLAERARVSEPTVYRHFPNREALIVALQARLEQRISAPLPRTLADFPGAVRAQFELFQDNATLLRAAMVQGSLVDELRRRGVSRRDRQVFAALDDAFTHLAPPEALAAKAVVRLLYSSEAWSALITRVGVEPSAAALALAWAVEALLAAAQRDQRAGRRSLATLANSRGRRARAEKGGRA